MRSRVGDTAGGGGGGEGDLRLFIHRRGILIIDQRPETG